MVKSGESFVKFGFHLQIAFFFSFYQNFKPPPIPLLIFPLPPLILFYLMFQPRHLLGPKSKLWKLIACIKQKFYCFEDFTELLAFFV